MSNKYTPEEEEIIRNNYELYGPKYCAKLLNRDESSVYTKAKRMKLKKNGREKHPSMQKINPEQFWNITTKEVAYFLGYLWADGYINYRKNKTCNNYKIALEIKSIDAVDILPIFNFLGVWAISTRKRKNTWEETTTISTNSKDLYIFLKDNNYNIKSIAEPTLILEKIPKHLRAYWWRGYFDGDGSISFGSYPARWKAIGFSAVLDCEWIEVKSLLSELNITKYNINKYVHKIKNHTSSKFTIQNKKEIIKFINFLLKSEIGLYRKTKKLNDFLLRYNKNPE